jgi:hypothetical protein
VRPGVVRAAPALEVPSVAVPHASSAFASLAIGAAVALLVTTALLTLTPPAATVMGRWRARRRPRF